MRAPSDVVASSTATPVLQDDRKDILVVRHGLSDKYYAYLQKFAETRGLEIVVDRRRSERRRDRQRAPEERRHNERRGPLPETWELADFVAGKRKA